MLICYPVLYFYVNTDKHFVHKFSRQIFGLFSETTQHSDKSWSNRETAAQDEGGSETQILKRAAASGL